MSEIAAQIIQELFVAEDRGDPLGSFPSLLRDGQPYNLWLTQQVLEPVLASWLLLEPRKPESAPAVAEAFSGASRRARAAFREVLPAAVAAGDPAILAALGVTANLQRTLGILGEHLLDGGRLVPAPENDGPAFRLSRWWCGLVEYPEESPYFTARVRPPLHPGRLQPRRRDPRHLANALWCSLSAINQRCDDALAVLREKIVRSGLYTPGEIKQLRGPSAKRLPRK